MDAHLQFRNLRKVVSLVASSTELSVIFKQLVYAACQDTAWAMATVLSLDQKSGYAYVMARHDPTLLETRLPDRWSLATSPARLALTALARNQPIVLGDALASDEFPECQQQAAQRGYRTVVLLPIGSVDAEGRPVVLSVQSRNVVAVSEEELAFLSTIVELGAMAVDNAHRLHTGRLLAERLQTALSTHTRLMNQVLADGSLVAATATLSELLPHPIVAVDFCANLVVGGRSALPDRFDDEGWRSALVGSIGAEVMRTARAAIDAHHSAECAIGLDKGARVCTSVRIEPLCVDGRAVGALLVFPTTSSGGELDQLLLEGAKFALSVQMMRSLIRFENESRTLADLFAELLERRWPAPEDLVARACRLGVTLSRPARLITVSAPTGSSSPRGLAVEMQRAVARCVQRLRPDGSVVLLDDTVVCHVPNHQTANRERTDQLIRSLVAETTPILNGQAIVVESEICQTLEDYATAWEQCRRITAVARRFERRGLLTAREFGPYPLLLGAAEATEVRLFVKHTIGMVVRHDTEHGTPYLQTLASYLQSGCRHQVCADAIGLHVTTLRYRLARIQQLFDIQLDTAEQRFALQLALHLHAIIGEPPPRSRSHATGRGRRTTPAMVTGSDPAVSQRDAPRALRARQPLSD